MQKKSYFYELDILRGIACLLVFFCHLPIQRIIGFSQSFIVGRCGVYLFFIISGFIISVGYDYQIKYADDLNFKNLLSNFEQNKLKIYQFWQRRFIRLFPTLLCLMIILLILIIRESIRNDVNLIFSLLVFVKYWVGFCFLNANPNGYVPTSSILFNAQAALWSLSGEMLCYIFFPILISFRKFPEYLSYFIISSLIVKIIFFYFSQDIYFGLLNHLDEFGVGVLIGLFYKKISINKSLLKILVVISTLNLIICFRSLMEYYIHYISILISGTILVYSSALQIGILDWRVFSRFLNYVGRRSYFIYVMHMVIDHVTYGPIKISYKYLAEYSVKINNLLLKQSPTLDHYRHLLVFFITLILAEIFYRCVEIPFNRKYKNKLSMVGPVAG